MNDIKLDAKLTNQLLSLYVYKDSDRPMCKHFMPIEWMGKKWISATDTRQVIVIEENEINKVEPPTEKTVDVVRILPEFNCDEEIDIAKLKRHYKNIPIVKNEIMETCDACDGDGKFEHYEEWYFCKTCDETGLCASGMFENIPDPTYIFKLKESFFDNKYISNLLVVIDKVGITKLSIRYYNQSKTILQLDNAVYILIAALSETRIEEMEEKTIIEI